MSSYDVENYSGKNSKRSKPGEPRIAEHHRLISDMRPQVCLWWQGGSILGNVANGYPLQREGSA